MRSKYKKYIKYIQMRIRLLTNGTSVLGFFGVIKFFIQKRFIHKKNSEFHISISQLKYPFYLRYDSSDANTFVQIHVMKEYAPLYEMSDVGLVIDCGANIGCASACFLSQFPSCYVIAVEADPSNYKMLQRNMDAYKDRVEILNAGVWSQTTPLCISSECRDGAEASRQVRPCKEEDADIMGVSIGSLLDSSKYERISLLKVDVEGAEAVIFNENIDWLDQVDVIAIELHDAERFEHFGKASEVFHRAVEGRGFELTKNGELTICYRQK